MLPVLLALGAALGFAVAAVLQQRAAARTRSHVAVDGRLLFRLFRRPLWVAGFAAGICSFSLAASALGTGRLVVVEPVLATGLLFALPLSTFRGTVRITVTDMVAALMTAGGVVAFLVTANPHGGRDGASFLSLGLAAAVVATCWVIAVRFAIRATPARRALLLGIAGGLGAGTLDAVTKSVARAAGSNALGVFTDPRLYLLAVVGLVTFTLQQNGYRAAGLAACLPAFAVLQPLTGSVLGLALYGERVHAAPAQLAVELIGAVIAALGIVRLARSPLVAA